MDDLIQFGECVGLGERSSRFIATILQHILSPDHGGLREFVDRFRRTGDGATVASCIARDPERLALTEAELDLVMPVWVVHQLCGLFWLSRNEVRGALRSLIPRLVHRLTPDGLVPDVIRPEIQRFVSTAWGSPPDTASGSPMGPPATHGCHAVQSARHPPDGNGTGRTDAS
ncbi:YidB family protein [Methylolobus aquaticus]